MWLKQNTAASIVVGPFVAETDGYTSQVSLTSLSGIIYKHNAASTAVNPNVTHTASGFYNLALASGSMDTLGLLRLGFANSSSHLPVWENFMVVPANTYDSLVGGTDRIDAELAGSGIAASTFAAGAIDATALAACAIAATKVGASVITNETFAACAVDSIAINATAADKVADHTLRREWGEAASSVDGDTKAFRSLLGGIAKLVNKIAESGGTLTVYEADDTTSLGTQTVTTSATAEPITELDTD